MPIALVTGITGQDGGFLVERLAADGYTVHGLVRGAEDLTDLQRRCPDAVLHEGELSDSAALAEALARSGADEVYHLAGISSVALSWEEPLLTAEVTALASARLLDLAWQHQERRGRQVRYLQASSAEIFGQADEAPQDESTPVRPTSPYGAAKAFAHHLTGVYRTRGMFAVSLVLYNHESDRRPPSFVTRKITQGVARIALGLQEELVLGNLEVRRDWGWAPDYVDAMVRAVRHERAEDYVIATGAQRRGLRRGGVRPRRGRARAPSRAGRPGVVPAGRRRAAGGRREQGEAGAGLVPERRVLRAGRPHGRRRPRAAAVRPGCGGPPLTCLPLRVRGRRLAEVQHRDRREPA